MNSIIPNLTGYFIRNSHKFYKVICSNNYLSAEGTRSYSYYYPGEKQYDPTQTVEYEISKDPEEWKYVTRLLPSKWIVDPSPKECYPSGWKPPDPEALQLPYYIRRTKNHMTPVYLKISQRGLRRLTTVRYIRGDIWLFHEHIKQYLEEKSGKQIAIKVDQVGCRLIVKGDHVNYIKHWLQQKGF